MPIADMTKNTREDLQKTSSFMFTSIFLVFLVIAFSGLALLFQKMRNWRSNKEIEDM